MNKSRRHSLVAVAASVTGSLLAAALLAGCAAGGPVAEQTSTASAGSSPSADADTSAIGGSGGPAPSDPTSTVKDGEVVANQPPPMLGQGVVTDAPVWDATAEKEAIDTASNGMALFSLTKDRSAADWKETMDDWLTPKAQQAWANVRPDLIPVKEILAMATLDADRSNPYWVWATVPTNDGDYRVQLYREGSGKPWLIDLIRPKNIKR